MAHLLDDVYLAKYINSLLNRRRVYDSAMARAEF
jgi:hypothetical protein